VFDDKTSIADNQHCTTNAQKRMFALSLSIFRRIRNIARHSLITLSLSFFVSQSASAAEESIWGPKTYPHQITAIEHSDNNVQAVTKFRGVRFGNSVYKLKGFRKGDMLQLAKAGVPPAINILIYSCFYR